MPCTILGSVAHTSPGHASRIMVRWAITGFCELRRARASSGMKSARNAAEPGQRRNGAGRGSITHAPFAQTGGACVSGSWAGGSGSLVMPTNAQTSCERTEPATNTTDPDNRTDLLSREATLTFRECDKWTDLLSAGDLQSTASRLSVRGFSALAGDSLQGPTRGTGTQ
jgi:hypothetical protein